MAVDCYTEFFYIGGLAFYYRPDPRAYGVAIFALLGALMISYSSAKAEAMAVTPPKGAMRRHERAAYLVCGAVAAAFTGPCGSRRASVTASACRCSSRSASSRWSPTSRPFVA